MNHVPRTTSSLAPWDSLQRSLGGRFRARARGLLGVEFALVGPRGGEEFGRLRMRGSLGATFRAVGLEAPSETEIERSGPFAGRYRMKTDGATVLLANPADPERGLRIFCGGKTYETETSVLRNTTTARLLPEGGEVRLAGGLAGRSYEATFPHDDGGRSLTVAVFLLYRNVALRREAF